MIKITHLDWRASDALIAQQESTINGFLSTRTLRNLIAVDEFLIADYVNTAETNPQKVKIFKFSESILLNGVSSTETVIANFIASKTIRKLLQLDEGIFLVVYND